MGEKLPTAIVLAAFASIGVSASAQQVDSNDTPYALPRDWVSRPTTGFLHEPSLLSKLAVSTDTGLGGEPQDGFYVETGNLVSGEGWISAVPGYRRTVLDGRARTLSF